ncbi:sugar phosphate isomerase/epimerase family protein [uncultured Ferrovibrio sp.]|jgi:D-psicose/D-tagatose/L-ribulose 3-epimerase|uniref:sugar phosphate isomerase/epimerase family protein n=1 Tax=uncultured Ferrovibrio sp. TaxID=1576913 RepID=UPI002604911E|nr:sugar phosphate isomerase/epimerase family protein [uncultured Ferrovibrio sp.]
MRIALCNEVLAGMPFEAQCAYAASLGYDGLEVAPFTLAEDPLALTTNECRVLRRAAEEVGIAITGLHWLLVAPKGLSLTDPDPPTRRRTIEAMKRLCGLCAELGGRYLVHGSPAQRRLPERDIHAPKGWALEAFRKAAEAAEEAGVIYCLEPLSRQETNFVNTVAEAIGIVEGIGSNHFCTMIDCSAAGLTEEQSVPQLIDEWMPSGLIRHIQVNDPNRRGPGQGEMDFAPILAALKRNNYQGDIGVEPFEYVPDGPGVAEHSIRYLRRILEALP